MWYGVAAALSVGVVVRAGRERVRFKSSGDMSGYGSVLVIASC